ncbi:hypothetical protein FQR65_LT11222 [Abscondita terminalis]|nr:hypothetical protein FQR65_LT11222 [Abscondita terminalis]
MGVITRLGNTLNLNKFYCHRAMETSDFQTSADCREQSKIVILGQYQILPCTTDITGSVASVLRLSVLVLPVAMNNFMVNAKTSIESVLPGAMGIPTDRVETYCGKSSLSCLNIELTRVTPKCNDCLKMTTTCFQIMSL